MASHSGKTKRSFFSLHSFCPKKAGVRGPCAFFGQFWHPIPCTLFSTLRDWEILPGVSCWFRFPYVDLCFLTYWLGVPWAPRPCSPQKSSPVSPVGSDFHASTCAFSPIGLGFHGLPVLAHLPFQPPATEKSSPVSPVGSDFHLRPVLSRRLAIDFFAKEQGGRTTNGVVERRCGMCPSATPEWIKVTLS